METETRKKPSFLLVAFIIIILAVIAFVVYYSVMELKSTSKKMAEISAEYGLAKYEKYKKLPKGIVSDSTFLALFKTKAYLQSRVAMAETDSVYLTMDLQEKVINIEISGVVVHSTSISEVETSKILTNGDKFAVASLLSEPLTIVNDTSSIAKIPFVTKIAPKDTSEFKPDAVPDTAFYEPVNYIFETDKGIKIMIFQSEEIKDKDNKDRFNFDLRHKIIKAKATFKEITAFKVPEYQPFIKIKIPNADAKIIYRAIPKYGQIGVNL